MPGAWRGPLVLLGAGVAWEASVAFVRLAGSADSLGVYMVLFGIGAWPLRESFWSAAFLILAGVTMVVIRTSHRRIAGPSALSGEDFGANKSDLEALD